MYGHAPIVLVVIVMTWQAGECPSTGECLYHHAALQQGEFMRAPYTAPHTLFHST